MKNNVFDLEVFLLWVITTTNQGSPASPVKTDGFVQKSGPSTKMANITEKMIINREY